MRLAASAWTDLADAPPPLLAVPLGSCEQHGPHLPLSTDTIVAEALACGLAERRPGVAVAPAVAVGASGEHTGFPGTLSIGSAALRDVLVELARSAEWADGLVLVNGHGGNRDGVDAAMATLHAERRPALSWWPSVPSGDAHAGRTETSLLLALAPALVNPARAVAGATAPLSELAARLRRDGVRAVSPTGVLGDPAGASADEGREILAALTDDLVAAVETWRTSRVDP